MHTLAVDLGDRSYPIYIDSGVLSSDLLLPHIRGKQVCIVTNSTVEPLYLSALKAMLADYSVDTVILDDGEQHKTLDTLNSIFNHLLEGKHSRATTLIALGGGVIGDMTGFAAACYQRGVNFIQVPTTLLAQVDSSVGGKTAVNHPLGKNMIGAFYQPQCVLIDTNVLSTLPSRELSAGLAEVIKYGLIADAEFFVWLEQNVDALMSLDGDALNTAILRSCACKASVVAQDETEAGVRAILNLGHTFGHAIEAALGYGEWLHGEAVAAGMVMAVDLSVELGFVSDELLQRTKQLLLRAKLPIQSPSSIAVDDFLYYMSLDKKVIDGALRLIVLESLGKAVIKSDIDSGLVKTVIERNML